MLSILALLLSLSADQAQAPVPAVFISQDEHAAVLKEQVAKNVVDQPIKATEVPGGKASVAMLHRVKPEVSALIHDHVTETYYILSGSGTIVTGGSLGTPKPTDLTRVNAGMSQTGTRIGGESRKVKPGDIVIVPAGTPHSFSALDGPISYLVYRFEPK
ncbi:MAG: AraC family ligand binding domain-containing protein [Vicinamibacterales bacterium]|jgi:mannose-6-phosphate isomerase-like protein (cupin superfamily)